MCMSTIFSEKWYKQVNMYLLSLQVWSTYPGWHPVKQDPLMKLHWLLSRQCPHVSLQWCPYWPTAHAEKNLKNSRKNVFVAVVVVFIVWGDYSSCVWVFVVIIFYFVLTLIFIALLNNSYVLQKKILTCYTHFPNVSLGTSIQTWSIYMVAMSFVLAIATHPFTIQSICSFRACCINKKNYYQHQYGRH